MFGGVRGFGVFWAHATDLCQAARGVQKQEGHEMILLNRRAVDVAVRVTSRSQDAQFRGRWSREHGRRGTGGWG